MSGGQGNGRESGIAAALAVLVRHGLAPERSAALARELGAPVLFDGDDAMFKALLPQVDTYFEYGCGQSTRYALDHSEAIICAVDTNPDWAARTRALAGPERLQVQWVDVGPVGDWGYPLSFAKRDSFAQYTDWFWTLGLQPDLVVIDGRFRVACFLTTLQRAAPGTTILFDDYTGRPQYHVAEEFLPVIERCGRQARFEVDASARGKVSDDLVASFRNVVA